MRTFRDWILFFAGAAALHTISHLYIAFAMNLPIETRYITLTSTMNTWTIALSALLTIALLWIAKRLNH